MRWQTIASLTAGRLRRQRNFETFKSVHLPMPLSDFVVLYLSQVQCLSLYRWFFKFYSSTFFFKPLAYILNGFSVFISGEIQTISIINYCIEIMRIKRFQNCRVYNPHSNITSNLFSFVKQNLRSCFWELLYRLP